LSDAPPQPTYSASTTELTSIDFTGKMPDYTIPTFSVQQDLYRCFVIPTNFNVDKFAAEVEVKPGNPAIVHHVIVFEDTAQAIVTNDNNDPGPGYTSFFGTGSGSSRMVGEWVPGTAPIKFPAGMGVRLRKNTRLILQIHYPKGTAGMLDSTRVNIKFAPGSPREVFIAPVLTENTITNPPFTIQPNTIATFKQTYTAPYPINYSILSVAPHMHLLGKKYKVYAVHNTNLDTIPYIYVDKWDFRWQGVYNFRNPVKFDGANYKIHGETEYDNTAANTSNPNSPPVAVSYGESTTDEMMQCYAALLVYNPGDENIVIDNSPLAGIKELQQDPIVRTLQLYNVFPNPAKNQAKLSYYSPAGLSAKASITTVEGKLVKEWQVNMPQGFGELNLDVEVLSKGQYFINLQTESYTKSRTFIIHE
jgi:hypothetical protein